MGVLLEISHRELCCIRLYVNSKTASTITTSIVQSKLDYCNSLHYNLPNPQLNRLQQIKNSFARAAVKAPISLTPFLFSNLYTGSKSINVVNISYFLLHTKSLLLLNLANSKICSLFRCLVFKLILHLLLPSLDHHHLPL